MNKSRNSSGDRKSSRPASSSSRGKSTNKGSSSNSNKYKKSDSNSSSFSRGGSKSTAAKRPYTKRSDDDSSSKRFTSSNSRGGRPTAAKRPYTKRNDDDSSSKRFASSDSRGGRRTGSKRVYGNRSEERDNQKPYGKSTNGGRSSSRFEKPTYGEKTDSTRSSYKKTPYNTDKKSYSNKAGKNKYDNRKGRKYEEEHEESAIIETSSRLNKYIANAGVCARREADKLIGAGLVTVNGKVITEMGFQVQPGDDVRYNGTRLSTEKKVYLIMNKPKDTICTLDDPEGRNIVTDLIDDKTLPRVYTIGRLDRNTTGVLMLTNDGELSQRLMHPKYQVQKIYKATLNKALKGEHLWELSNGIELEDGIIKADSIAVPDPKSKENVVIEIHSGRNRIIHRMFEHLGYRVDRLDRIWYAGFDKRSLKRGQWRHLSDKELTRVKKLVKLA
jgi:23S rRNA pseudouridine2605 synthase